MDRDAYNGSNELRQRQKQQRRQAFYIAFYAAMGVSLAASISVFLLFLLSVVLDHWGEIQSAFAGNLGGMGGGLLVLGLIFGYLGIQVIRGWKRMKAAIRQKG